ncbi:hypothetical protein [Sphingomonas hengshuiensis]|nr:hypothetical protein [Sphingomonas hengshuiensis]
MTLIFALMAAIAPIQAGTPEWMMVGLTDNGADGISVIFVDRASISQTPDEASATISLIKGENEIRPRMQFDCKGSRFRLVSAGMPDGIESSLLGWKTLGSEPSGMRTALQYACSGGTLDLGFDPYKGPSPMPFYKLFIALRAESGKKPSR